MRFQGMARVSDGKETGPRTSYVVGGRFERCTIGAPSTELSLGGLLASRAHLRFTRRADNTEIGSDKQEEVGLKAGTSRDHQVYP